MTGLAHPDDRPVAAASSGARIRRLCVRLLVGGLCFGALGAQAAPWSVPAAGVRISGLPAVPATLQFEGVTAYEPAALLRFALAHAGSSGTLSAQQVADTLALIYREDGYLLAEVTWRYDAASSTLTWDVSEGHVDQLQILGVDSDTADAIRRTLAPVLAARPLQQRNFERALALAGDLSGVSLSSRLRPTAGSTGSTLLVDAAQLRHRGAISVDAVPMRPGYSKRLAVQAERYGTWVAGDLLRGLAMVTRDPDHGTAVLGTGAYRAPVNDDGRYVEALVGNARINRGLADSTDRTESRGFNASLALGQAWRRDLHGFDHWVGALEHADAKGRTDGSEPRSRATLLRGYLVHSRTHADGMLTQGSLALSAGRRGALSIGADGRPIADGDRFVRHLRGGLGLSGPWTLGEHTLTYRLEGALQWTPKALPRVEKMLLGHYPYLRGYAPAEATGDRGAAFTFELVHRGRVADGLSAWQPFAFVSAGRVSTVGSTADAQTLASSGLGLRAPLGDRLQLEAWAAVPLRKGPLSARGKPAGYLSLTLPW